MKIREVISSKKIKTQNIRSDENFTKLEKFIDVEECMKKLE